MAKVDTLMGKRSLPLSLLFLSGALKKSGYDVAVIHCTPEEMRRKLDWIDRKNPIFVGFSVITGIPTLYAAQMSREIKKKCDTPVVWGGVHPTLLPEQCLQESYIDMVVLGEGEETVVEIADRLSRGKSLEGVKGVGYKHDGKIKIEQRRPFIKNLDSFRIDFECVNLKEYIYPSRTHECRRRIEYFSSRGCPYNCGFCYNLAFHKRRWRGYSTDTVIEDIEYLKSKYNVDHVLFNDDNFFVNKNRAFEIVRKIDLPFSSSMRIDYITDKVARTLKELGCKCLYIGMESGSDRILKLMNKGIRVADTIRAAHRLAENELRAQYSAIFGLPTETEQEMEKTMNLIFRILDIHKESQFSVGPYIPYPGTDLYSLAIKEGFEPPSRTDGWSKLDRWKDTVDLPWIDTKSYFLLRLYLLSLHSNIKLISRYLRFRLKYKNFMKDYDTKLVAKVLNEVDRGTTIGLVFSKLIRNIMKW
ncbi:MAG: B12-binding domain-containing radical SAM protein [Candidatus Bathyarchaeia archaeon]